MSNKMLEIKKLKDFMKERGIQEGEQFAMLPLTNWYMFDDCFGQIIGLFDKTLSILWAVVKRRRRK